MGCKIGCAGVCLESDFLFRVVLKIGRTFGGETKGNNWLRSARLRERVMAATTALQL
jgi:hypothetical protein